jgi:hypothetical protein
VCMLLPLVFTAMIGGNDCPPPLLPAAKDEEGSVRHITNSYSCVSDNRSPFRCHLPSRLPSLSLSLSLSHTHTHTHSQVYKATCNRTRETVVLKVYNLAAQVSWLVDCPKRGRRRTDLMCYISLGCSLLNCQRYRR